MYKKLCLVLALAIALSGCGLKTKAPVEQASDMPDQTMDEQKKTEEKKMVTAYKDIKVKLAKDMIDKYPDLIVIDVSPRYDEGHLPGAINYYVGDGSLDKAIPSLDKEARYLVYCHVDSASILGAQKLIDAGFRNVYRLEGNYSAWVDAGYPIEK
ncbi:hypothetical protein GF382_01015 [Candidatus Falkowbacteria bacterium]|nr:hypothetical protein [Candidatus Falkowbacteria bacterium]